MGIDWDTIAPFDAELVKAEVAVADAEIAGNEERIRVARRARTVARAERDSVMSRECSSWLNQMLPRTQPPPQ